VNIVPEYYIARFSESINNPSTRGVSCPCA